MSHCSELSYGSHTNTHRLTDSSSHRGSKHLLATPGHITPGHNGVGHNGLNGLTEALNDVLPDDEKDEMLNLNQVQAELMLDVNAQEMMLNEYPADCCPVKFYLNFPCLAGDDDSPFWQGWANLRIKTFRLIENKYFETAVIAMILISSLALVSLHSSHSASLSLSVSFRLRRTSTWLRGRSSRTSSTTWTGSSLSSSPWRWWSSGSPWALSSTSPTPGAGWTS